MYNFLVLGQVPGTDIQITFTLWLQALEAVLVLMSMLWLFTHRRTIKIMVDDAFQARQPLHATQLHQRAQ